MNEVPRYASLRDYLGVLRAHRVLIVVIALVFAGAAYGYSVSQESSYRTASSVYFQDQTQNVNLFLGTALAPTQSPQQQASVAAATLGRANVVAQVRQIMGRSYAAGTASVSPLVSSTTSFLVIQVDSHFPAYAARLANAYAQAQQIVSRSDSRGTFANAAVALRQQLSKVHGQANNPGLRTLYEDRIARLKFLAATSDPVVITQRAGVPATPISPRPVRNALLGLLVGLTLGVLAAFFRDSLDRRLRRSDDISEQLGWPIIGHVREQALGGAPLVRNGGASIDEQDLEAFHILRQNLQFLNVDEPPRAVAVTSGLPEEGKSTVALSLAAAAAMAGKLTLLVECDLRRPALASRIGINLTPGLTDFLVREAEPAEILQRVPLGGVASPNGNGPADPDEAQAVSAQGEPALVCIAAGRSAVHPAELLGSERFRAFIKQVTDAYDFVVFDTPPLLPVADTLEILPSVDAVLVCVRTPKTTREEARAVKQTLVRAPGKPIGIVVTGVRPGDEYDFGYYSYSYSYSSAGARG